MSAVSPTTVHSPGDLSQAPAISDVGRSAIRKATRRLIPIVGLCYLVLYLDRLNIGVAALTMNTDLGLSASAFGFASGVYFWSYTVLEPASNFVLVRVGARRWIGRIMITWGLVTIATAFIANDGELIAARVLLGIAEAGFSPGMLYLVSRWFPAAHRGRAMSLVVVFICLSSLGTPAATEILAAMDGVLHLAGWRWIFILTGVPAIVMGLVCLRWLYEGPGSAPFMSREERAWFDRENAVDDPETAREADTRRFLTGLVHPRVLMLVCAWLGFTFSLNGFQIWLPQILARFDLGKTEIGWIAALPALLAIVPMLLWLRHSDRHGERRFHFAAAAATSVVGFAIAALSLSTLWLAVAGFCIAGIGLYSAMGVFITMPATFLGGASLAAGLGVINGVGNLGGYFGPQVTGWLAGSTHDFTAALLLYAAAMAVAGVVVLASVRIARAPAQR